MTSITTTERKPIANVGMGLRSCHTNEILLQKPKIHWLELLGDNHMSKGGLARVQARQLSALYPVTIHCVGMSIGSTNTIDFNYLKRLKSLMEEVEPAWVSDHLCWTSLNSIQSHDLLPLPYTEEALTHVVSQITQIQNYLNVQIVIENVSSYLTFKHSTMSEWEFLRAVAEQADCFILLDLNNIYVNHYNHHFSINDYLEHIPFERVREIHLAGFEDKGNYLLDAHNNHVSTEVWNIYQSVMRQQTAIPILIEWDNDIPELSVLISEVNKAQAIMEQYRDKKAIHAT
jgi:uncharacterized protein